MSHNILVPPDTKILIDALAAFLQLPQPTIVDKALRTYRNSLRPEDRATIEAFCGRAITNREAFRSEATKHAAAGQPTEIYESTRFCFKRDRIEKLGPQDEFRMITPVGVFQMSKTDFHREFSNVAASKSYKAGVYNYPRLPSKAEKFRVPGTTLHEIKRCYQDRVRALLNRWRQACLAKNWPTTEPDAGFEEPPTGHPVYSWWIEAQIGSDRKAHIAIMLESETDAAEDGGSLAVVNCLPSISLGMMGSDYVKLETPSITVLLDDTHAFEAKFQLLEQVTGREVSDAIEHHVGRGDLES